MHDLDEARRCSDAGSLLERVLELEYTLDKFKVDWQDVTAEECKALQVLNEERQSHRAEQQEQEEQERQMQQRMKG